MKTVTFTYLGAKCEYNFKTRNLHIISKQSFKQQHKAHRLTISKKHNINKTDIKSITFKYNNTKLPSNLYNYFSNYTNLEYIELEKLSFKNIESINRFIYNCPKIKKMILDLDKFEDINKLTPHLNSTADNNINKHQYTGIKLGKHKIKIIDYKKIIDYNIPILDKTEEEIVKEIITQSKYESKTTIQKFLTTLETKNIFKNEKYKDTLTSKLDIIINLK